MLPGLLALVVAALFTGAAVYISVAEHPARLGLDDRSLLAEWKPAYARGYAMQASLAVLGFLLGAAAWWQTGRAGFALGAVLLVANWPWTLVAMKPTNVRLMAMPIEESGPASRALIRRWGGLHAVRGALGAAATLVLLAASLP